MAKQGATKHLTLHCVTYNLAELKFPEGADISSILGLEHKPDLISIGLEESSDFDVYPDEENDKQDPWCKEFDRLVADHGYFLVNLTSVWKVKIRLYLKKEHMHAISHVEAVTAKSGFVGGVRNIFKGACTVRFRLYGKHVAIINCHLTAFDPRTLDRNTEYWMYFADQEFEDPECEELYEHDYIFWTGDLNYRIEKENTAVREIIGNGEHLSLLPFDQLKRQQDGGLAFWGFHEPPITFPPSYKFDQGTDIYDTSEKQRVPSYCDRVLWRCKEESTIAASQVNWAASYEVDSSESEEELSTKLVEGTDGKQNEKQKKKKRLFKKKAMEKDDATLEKEHMRRKTLGVLRRMSLNLMLHQRIDGEERIDLEPDTITDASKYEALISEIDRRTKAAVKTPSVNSLGYRSYPHIKISDHKPVSATLSVKFTECPPFLEMKHPQWTMGHRLKVNIKFEQSHEAYSSNDWVALFPENWVNKSKYLSWGWVQKKQKPKGQFKYKVKFSTKSHPGRVMNLQLVYFRGSNTVKPIGFQNIESV